jgi:hypothetical protein
VAAPVLLASVLLLALHWIVAGCQAVCWDGYGALRMGAVHPEKVHLVLLYCCWKVNL